MLASADQDRKGTTSVGEIIDRDGKGRAKKSLGRGRRKAGRGPLTSVITGPWEIRITVFLTFSSTRARNPGSSNLGGSALGLALRYSRSLTISSLKTRPIAKKYAGREMEGKSKYGNEGGQL